MVRNCQLSDLIYLTALRGPVSLCVRVCGAGSGVVLEGSSAPFSPLFLHPIFSGFPAKILVVLLGPAGTPGKHDEFGNFPAHPSLFPPLAFSASSQPAASSLHHNQL